MNVEKILLAGAAYYLWTRYRDRQTLGPIPTPQSPRAAYAASLYQKGLSAPKPRALARLQRHSFSDEIRGRLQGPAVERMREQDRQHTPPVLVPRF